MGSKTKPPFDMHLHRWAEKRPSAYVALMLAQLIAAIADMGVI